MKLHLDIFEGPLDLLLYLIKRHNLEISKISLATVTEQYLDYLNTMRELDIDLASDFLYMAAELTHLKSCMLLPKPEQADDDESETDRAGELLKKLRVYQYFKDLARQLAERHWLGREVYGRGAFANLEEDSTADDAVPAVSPKPVDGDYEVNLYELVESFNSILKKMPDARREHQIVVERVSITERIYEILDRLGQSESVLFTDFFMDQVQKIDVIVTFLAVLEMAKLKMAHVFQSEPFGPIRLKKRLESVVPETLQQQVSEDLGESYGT